MSANGHKPPLKARRGSPQQGVPQTPSPPGPHHDVFVGFLAGNSLTTSFHKSLRDVWFYDGAVGGNRLYRIGDGRAGPLQLPDGRNKICQAVLDSECEWLWMVDSDMGFENDTLHRLLSVADPKERPVVGALCFSMREISPDGMGGMHTYPTPTLLMWQEHDDGISRFTGPAFGQNGYPVNSMIKIGATGAACLLIHRSVLERIGKEWFNQISCPDGSLEGEDISFCHRCRDADIPIWVHTGIRTTHMKTIWLSEIDYWTSIVAPPATETVDVIIPALHRPQNVKPLMESLRATTGLATAWWVCEPGDEEQIAAVIEYDGIWCSNVLARFARR